MTKIKVDITVTEPDGSYGATREVATASVTAAVIGEFNANKLTVQLDDLVEDATGRLGEQLREIQKRLDREAREAAKAEAETEEAWA